MTDEHKALVEALETRMPLISRDREAARAIRDLSAEVESLAAQLREQAILELAQMGQECDRHD